MLKNKEPNAFEVFDVIPPQKKDESIEIIYEYEKHYMKLIKEYKPEIDYIAKHLNDLRFEQIDFLENKLPRLKEILIEQGIDNDLQSKWLSEIIENINRSYLISEKLITHYLTKNIDEFKETIDEKIKNL